MKPSHLFILLAGLHFSTAYAEDDLQTLPKLDMSPPSPTVKPPAVSKKMPKLDAKKVPKLNQDDTSSNASTLEKLKNDVFELKIQVQAHEDAIIELKNTTAELKKQLSAKTAKSADDVTEIITGDADEKDHYDKALALLEKGDYSKSVTEFQTLLKAYPNGEYADNAQYWLGVAQLNKGEKNAAINTFDKLPRLYPNSDKIPDALYKLATTLVSMNNTSKAKEYFDYLIVNYPTSKAAALARKARVGL